MGITSSNELKYHWFCLLDTTPIRIAIN